MKKTCFATSSLFFTFIFLFVACKKDPLPPFQRIRIDIPIIPFSNPIKPPKAPIARAGNDSTIYLPYTMAELNGFASSDEDGKIKSYNWRMINGPTTVSITYYDKAKTFIRDLEKVGDYEFELTVTDSVSLSTKDTVKITVATPNCTSSNKELFFKDLSWNLAWIMEIDFFNFLSLLPPNSYLQNVYIKRDGSADWEKVVPMNINNPNYELHNWEYGNGVLVIYPSNNMTRDTPDIKIEYCN